MDRCTWPDRVEDLEVSVASGLPGLVGEIVDGTLAGATPIAVALFPANQRSARGRDLVALVAMILSLTVLCVGYSWILERTIGATGWAQPRGGERLARARQNTVLAAC